MRTKPFTSRITPAWAGKSFVFDFTCPHLQDHPRVGGEKPRQTLSSWPVRGSPPRGRGKVHHHVIKDRQHRITPAWAGKSLAFSSSASRS